MEMYWVKLDHLFLPSEIPTTTQIIGICKEIYHGQIDYSVSYSMLA